MELFFGYMSFVVGFILYFLPFIVATSRRHNNRIAILLLNILLGWIFVGWSVALVWSATDNIEDNQQQAGA